jgi:hypothetical protein
VEIFDGVSPEAQLLARVCHGDRLPPIISSKNELVLVFSSSAFDHPSQPAPLRHVMGFEFDVEVKFMDKEPYAKRKPNTCNTVIASSQANRAGVLRNPVRSLPPNTTCTFFFKGQLKQLIVT